jgi:hypothetical protein
MFLIIHSITSAEKKNGNTDNIGSIVLIYFLLSYLSWKKRNTQKKRNIEKEKENQTNKHTCSKKSTVSTYNIKVRNKQQETRMPPTTMFVNENEKMKKRDKQKATNR